MKRTEQKSDERRLRKRDILIIILCLFIAAYSVNLFRNDLYQTIRLQNVQSVGTITIRNNTVQRRIADRVLWDRLRVTSPVYLGDIIRVAELSAATLNIEDQQIDIEENTLIRIQLAPDGSGALQIELTEGNVVFSNLVYSNLVYSNAQSGGIQFNLTGGVITTGAGTAFSAAAGKDGMVLQVHEGTAVFTGENGESREMAPGTMIALDRAGTQRRAPAAVVTRPRPNARYVKSEPRPLPVSFAWNRVNLRPEDTLRLEIAADGNFSRMAQSLENLVSAAEVSLEEGAWNWRLSREGVVLSSGRLTIVETAQFTPSSPARGSLFRYTDEQPALRLQWPEIEGAAHYVVEIAPTPDFARPQITKQIDAPFFVDSSLAEGTWYWRVKPVFAPSYEGAAPFSPVSFFVIEQKPAAEGQAVTLLEGAPLTALERSVGSEPPPPVRPEPVTALAATPPQPAPAPRTPPRREQPPAPVTQPAPAPVTVTATPPAAELPPTAAEPQPQPTASIPPPQAPAAPSQTAQAPPLLPAPAGREPAHNYRVDIEWLKTRRNIDFRWGAVQGANAYIFTLYAQTANGRRQIHNVTVTNPAWTLENVEVLGRGNFVWQIEAVNRDSDGVILQRGTPGENAFAMDIPSPNPVQMIDPGVLYGF